MRTKPWPSSLVAVILMRNWHQPGVAANMTLDEINNSSKAEDKHGCPLRVVRTLQHKTVEIHRPTLVTLTEEDYRLILRYVSIEGQDQPRPKHTSSLTYCCYLGQSQ